MKVLVCDDHQLLRRALNAVVRSIVADAEVEEAADYPSALDRLQAEPAFALCLLDLHMPGADPLTGLSRIRALRPVLPVLVITGSEDDDLLVGALRLNVDGFALKSDQSEVLEAAIRLVLAGGVYLPPRLAGLVVTGAGRSAPAARPSIHLSQRQTDVLRLMSGGSSNKDIARQLQISPATVKAHAANVMAALGAANRTEAAAAARAAGLL